MAILIILLYFCHNWGIQAPEYQYAYAGSTFITIPEGVLDKVKDLENEDETVLSEYEGIYLNSVYNIRNDVDDLRGKKLIFITGNRGSLMKTKKDYFNYEYSHYIRDGKLHPPYGVLFLFKEEEIQKTGYDGALIYCSKRIPKRSELIRFICKHNNKLKSSIDRNRAAN